MKSERLWLWGILSPHLNTRSLDLGGYFDSPPFHLLIYVDITYVSSPWLFGHLDQCGVGGAAAKMPPSRAPSGNDDGGGADSMLVRSTVSETG